VSNPATCTAYWRTRDGYLGLWAVCGEPALYEVADTFFCDHHYRRALQWAETAVRCQAETVYYVRRADGMIKVGTSRKAATRLAALAREHGQLALMAIQAGGHKEESAVHRKFRELHIGGEWFHPELPLLQHIVRVRKATGNLEREDDGLPPRMSGAALGRLIRDAKERWATWGPVGS
jgi:hypothetical protein